MDSNPKRLTLYFRVYADLPTYFTPDDVISDVTAALRTAGYECDYSDGWLGDEEL